jgi:large-conductance mechanosensitive channel
LDSLLVFNKLPIVENSGIIFGKSNHLKWDSLIVQFSLEVFSLFDGECGETELNRVKNWSCVWMNRRESKVFFIQVIENSLVHFSVMLGLSLQNFELVEKKSSSHVVHSEVIWWNFVEVLLDFLILFWVIKNMFFDVGFVTSTQESSSKEDVNVVSSEHTTFSSITDFVRLEACN